MVFQGKDPITISNKYATSALTVVSLSSMRATIKLYLTMAMPVLLCGSETPVTTRKNRHLLRNEIPKEYYGH